jgi:hypothetical protein
VASVGVNAVVQANGFISTNNGTSFACPNMAGLGTCLWQGFPEFNNIRILKALHMAGSRATNPDDRVGYGIPNMKSAFANLLAQYATSSSSITGCQVTLNWNSKDVQMMKYEIERKGPSDPQYVKVGELNPQAGTLLANHSYQFVNNLTGGSSGTYSYRIRQILDTAVASFYAAYIDTTNIVISSPCIVTGVGNNNPLKKTINLLPNPVSANSVTLVIETSYAITNMPILVYDSRGALVMQVNSSKGTGKLTLDLPVMKLARGKYIVKVLDGNKIVGTAELLRL